MAHIGDMAGKHDPSKNSLQRWSNEGGAPKGGRAKRPRDPDQLAKAIVDIAKPGAAAKLGRKDGEAQVKSVSPKRRKGIAKRAAAQRWAKKVTLVE